MKPTTHLQPGLKLRTGGAIILLPHTPSWRRQGKLYLQFMLPGPPPPTQSQARQRQTDVSTHVCSLILRKTSPVAMNIQRIIILPSDTPKLLYSGMMTCLGLKKDLHQGNIIKALKYCTIKCKLCSLMGSHATYKAKVKAKFTKEQATKTLKGSKGIALLFL